MARVVPILPNGKPFELIAGKQKSFGVELLGRNGQPRDISTDTLTVSAKLETTTKTLTITKDTPNTDGRATVTVPASELTGAGTLYVDVLAAKSGGTAEVVSELSIPVVAALA